MVLELEEKDGCLVKGEKSVQEKLKQETAITRPESKKCFMLNGEWEREVRYSVVQRVEPGKRREGKVQRNLKELSNAFALTDKSEWEGPLRTRLSFCIFASFFGTRRRKTSTVKPTALKTSRIERAAGTRIGRAASESSEDEKRDEEKRRGWKGCRLWPSTQSHVNALNVVRTVNS